MNCGGSKKKNRKHCFHFRGCCSKDIKVRVLRIQHEVSIDDKSNQYDDNYHQCNNKYHNYDDRCHYKLHLK